MAILTTATNVSRLEKRGHFMICIKFQEGQKHAIDSCFRLICTIASYVLVPRSQTVLISTGAKDDLGTTVCACAKIFQQKLACNSFSFSCLPTVPWRKRRARLCEECSFWMLPRCRYSFALIYVLNSWQARVEWLSLQ